MLVSLVTYNSASFLPQCLASIRAQSYTKITVMAADNGSTDESIHLLRSHLGSDNVIDMKVNRGYSAAHNEIIRRSDSDFVLCLNPDVMLDRDYIWHVVRGAACHKWIGSLCGQVWKVPAEVFSHQATVLPLTQRYLDTTGIFPRWLGTAFDRDQGSFQRGGWVSKPHLVFGASGCAAVYRREALRDVEWGDQTFDEDFFMLFEDVDLAWRLQHRGWLCAYIPTAVAYHVRSFPGRATREVESPAIRRHLTRNRWLVAIKEFPFPMLAYKVPVMVAKDLALAPTWLWKSSSSRVGYADVIRLLPRMMAKRRYIMSRRTTSMRQLLRWSTRRVVQGGMPVGKHAWRPGADDGHNRRGS